MDIKINGYMKLNGLFGGTATGAFLHYLMDYSTPKGDSNGLCED